MLEHLFARRPKPIEPEPEQVFTEPPTDPAAVMQNASALGMLADVNERLNQIERERIALLLLQSQLVGKPATADSAATRSQVKAKARRQLRN